MTCDVCSANANRWLEDPGWRGKIGFISPPHMSIDATEFLRIAPPGFRVCQTMTYVPGFQLNAGDLVKAAEQLEGCSMALRQAGVDLIAQCGTPFSFAQGGFIFGKEVQTKIEKATGLPMVMMGFSIINALKKMGYRSVAVACTYYSDDIAQMYTRFFEDSGIKVAGMENWVSQGIFTSQDEVSRAMSPVHTRITMGLVYKSAKTVAQHHPEADCIIISGGGVSTMDVLQALEEDMRKPVISSLAALFWEILHRQGVFAPIRGRGSLLATLEKGL